MFDQEELRRMLQGRCGMPTELDPIIACFARPYSVNDYNEDSDEEGEEY